MVESGIAASVLVVGLMVATSMRLSTGIGMAVVGAFAVFHGHAHFAQMALTTATMQYAIGIILATAALLAIGLGLGLVAQRLNANNLVRAAGAGIAIAGILLMAGVL